MKKLIEEKVIFIDSTDSELEIDVADEGAGKYLTLKTIGGSGEHNDNFALESDKEIEELYFELKRLFRKDTEPKDV